jgi:hypothetical protein
MAELSIDDLVDLTTVTLSTLDKGKWQDIATDLQEYVALKKLLKKNKISFDSGKAIDVNVMVDYEDSAQNVGLFHVDDVNVSDGMKRGSIPWRSTTANYAWDVQEVAVNRNPARIIDLLKTRRAGSMISLAAKMESNFWGKPATSSDNVMPFGIQYWIVPNSAEGFNGGAAAGFTSGPAGLSPTTYTRWKNWTAQYTNVTQEDFIQKIRQAMVKTNFMSPVDDMIGGPTGDNYGYYTNYDVIYQLENVAAAQNDNLGNDVASKDGRVLFYRRPVTYVPYLDSNNLEAGEQDPFYGINWSVFQPVFLQGFYMKEGKPRPSPKQHNVVEVHWDLTYNFRCVNRRRCFIVNKSA